VGGHRERRQAGSGPGVHDRGEHRQRRAGRRLGTRQRPDALIDKLAATDPNLADDADSLTVGVSAAPVSAGGISTTPPHPRARTLFVVGFGVEGATVSSTKCASSVGIAQAHRTAARASCTVRTPKSAAGKVVHGSLTAVAGEHTLTRRFSVKLR
jgi:hypothetical protein